MCIGDLDVRLVGRVYAIVCHDLKVLLLQQGIRLACEDGAPINGQAPDIELKNFFALSRFSGSVTQQLQKVAPAALEAVSVRVVVSFIPYVFGLTFTAAFVTGKPI